MKSHVSRILFDYPFFSLDTSKNSKLALIARNKDNNSTSVSVEINTNSTNHNKNNSSYACYLSEISSIEGVMSSTKAKVPDILMINKYYGLIPKKFTISSRQSTNSTPSSAGSSSRRCSKHNSINKPRAKSSTLHNSHQNRYERKSEDEIKGCRSENDSPDPIKMFLVARRSSTVGYENSDEKTSDPFGPVSKKMSVERYKKWRNGGGGKGRSLNMRSNSDIGQTLSLLDNGLPGGGFNSHAKSRVCSAAELTTNRRVIKIDLNRVSSWDDENFRITTSSLDSSTAGENKEIEMKAVNPTAASIPVSGVLMHDSRNTITASNNNNGSYSSSDYSCSSTCYSRSSSVGKSSPVLSSSRRLDNNENYTCFVNNDNDCDVSLITYEDCEEQTTFMSSISQSVDTNENSSQSMSTVRDSSNFNSCTSIDVSASIRNDSIHDERLVKEEQLAEENRKNINMPLQDNDMVESREIAKNDCQKKREVSIQSFAKLSSRTISFDEKILDGPNNATVEGEASSGRSVKKRPTTASARVYSKTFTTPNGFNPPSKVIPWTQQKTAGGKALTLAERRAKFQRAPSIHSSSSMSMENGEEEVLSEVESNSHLCVRPPSSAFRESRKPLHVTQPPEIPTMIAQINPNADEDIQIEIEKVALMLRKMNSMKHFSMSLDSGIEAEMVKASSIPEEAIPSPGLKNVASNASTESVAKLSEESKISNVSGSESSISSSEASEEEEHSSQQSSKQLSCESSTKAPGLSGKENGAKPLKEKTLISDNFIKRQSFYNYNNNNANRSVTNRKKISQGSSMQSEGSTSKKATTPILRRDNSSAGTAHRPPLTKAMSISCEQELLKTDGDRKRNEVNFNSNDNGKSPRPKTATAASYSQNQKTNVSGTRSIHNNYQHRQNSVSSSESRYTTSTCTSTSAGNGSQGSRNRKILIKKALMEINQSSVSMQKKWGTFGRPRTAPSSDKSSNSVQHSGLIGSHKQFRKPLKASPLPISGNGRMGSSSSGKQVLAGGSKINSGLMEGEKSKEKSSQAGQTVQRSSSEAPADDTSSSQQQQSNEEKSSKERNTFRQCFSLDESALLGFSIKSVNGGRIPIFEKMESTESTESCPNSIMDDEISFLSSKKREQCLKVYEKMIKTGCTIKLETIFRGMLTPSEYRAFMRAAEKASQEAEVEESDQYAGESLPDEIDTSTK